jgi:preprotein translocase subunit SecG
MTTLLIIIHVLVSLFLIAIVLLQHGKGADIGATFGGSGQSVFGSEGPVPLLNKITTFSAIIFMGTSISLAYMSANEHSNSIMKDLPAQEVAPAQKEVPVTIPMPGTDSPSVNQVEKPAPEAAPAVDGEEVAPEEASPFVQETESAVEASPAVQEALSEENGGSPAIQESEAAQVELPELPAMEEEPVAEMQDMEVTPAAEEQVAPVEQETETAPEQAE